MIMTLALIPFALLGLIILVSLVMAIGRMLYAILSQEVLMPFIVLGMLCIGIWLYRGA